MNNRKTVLALTVIMAAFLSIAWTARADDNQGNNEERDGSQPQSMIGSDQEEKGGSWDANQTEDVQKQQEADHGRQDSEHRSPTSTVERQDNGEHGDAVKKDVEQEQETDQIDISHDDVADATSTLDDPHQVHDRGELRSFLNHVVKEDNRIASVQTSSTTIATDYSLPADLFGAIPAHIQAQVSVNADGTVSISYPWYAFFFGKNDAALRSDLQAVASSSVQTQLSPSLQARLLDSIISVLKKN